MHDAPDTRPCWQSMPGCVRLIRLRLGHSVPSLRWPPIALVVPIGVPGAASHGAPRCSDSCGSQISSEWLSLLALVCKGCGQLIQVMAQTSDQPGWLEQM